MAKTYTLIAEHNFSGSTPIKIGEKINNLTALQVSRFLKNGSGKFETEKETETFLDEFESEKREKAEVEAQAKSLLEKETLQNDLTLLCTQVVEKVAAIRGEVFTGEEVLEGVETLLDFLHNEDNEAENELKSIELIESLKKTKTLSMT